jgi:hypothetical protein
MHLMIEEQICLIRTSELEDMTVEISKTKKGQGKKIEKN